MAARKIFFSFFFLMLLVGMASAAGIFPYGNLSIRTPAQEDPFPGIGSNYSSLGKGMDFALWNPASLGRIGSSEIQLGLTSTAVSPPYSRNYNVQDSTFEVGSNSSGFTNAVLYTDDPAAVLVGTREYTGKINYSTTSTGVGYKQSIKTANGFAFGVATRGETGYSFDLAGSFPLQWKSDMNLYNASNFMGTGITINNAGFMTYTHTIPNGPTYTATSAATVWSGFLSQTQRIPFTVISDSHNDLNIQSNLTMTGAYQMKNIFFGANITPISATANIDNSLRAIANPGTDNVFFYTPNFDSNNQADVNDWTANANRYGSVNGYKKSYITVPAGETIAEAKYDGFYTASAIKMDLGGIYEMNENFSVGMALENFNNAALDFKGHGRVAYVNSRVMTSEGGSPIDPAGGGYNFFSGTFTPVKDTENIGMFANIPVSLPQRLRVGATLKKPFLITLDYEQQATPITYRAQQADKTYSDIVFSDIKFIRGGIETQLLFLPLWLRGGLTVLMKPTVTGADQNTMDSINKAFKYKVLPTKLDLGLFTKVRGLDIGGDLGVSAMPFLSTLQLDTLNQDFSKILYYNFYLKKDFWSATYASVLDPGATAAAYSAASDKNNALAIAKMINTLTISVRF